MHVVSPGIYRAEQPRNLFTLEAYTKLGVRTVLDLENEIGEAPWEDLIRRRLGLDFVTLPISALTCPPEPLIEEILGVMADPKRQPILVHCRHGRDRTGLVCGMYRRRVEGWTRREAWREMRRMGYRWILPGPTFYFWTAK